MIDLNFEKLSRYERKAEPCTVAIPFPQGNLTDKSQVAVLDEDKVIPCQTRVTAEWPDGSIKWLLMHLLPDLPGNAGKHFKCVTNVEENICPSTPVTVNFSNGRCNLDTGNLFLELSKPGEQGIFNKIVHDTLEISRDNIKGPLILHNYKEEYGVTEIDESGWQVIEEGPIRSVLQANGTHRHPNGEQAINFTVRIYAFAGKPWIKMDYQIIHKEDCEQIDLQEIKMDISIPSTNSSAVRTSVARSNYRSTINHSDNGEEISHIIDANQLLYEANEQIPETLYGTFWADWNDPDKGGVAATLYQAHQNFPKAFLVDGSKLEIAVIPKESNDISLLQGVGKTHKLFLHFHDSDKSLEDINVRSLQFQLPDRPTIPSEVYYEAGVIENVAIQNKVPDVEKQLLVLADSRARGYGVLNWGDGPDVGYTNQGRGKGEPVWTNNEYDLPHGAMVLYAHTRERRMLDYLLAAAEHWFDVDVCHYSDDPLRFQGQIIHSARHATEKVTMSHEWVAGLLDYYHQTGEQFALDTAIGIGENVLRHLQLPKYQELAGSAARETGWALRSLISLYNETYDEKWLEPSELIVKQFAAWQDKYGAWLAPYTDHTLARVPFMISIAATSLMYYYRLTNDQKVGSMIVNAMDDLLENCRQPDGRFYYKELPSLRRSGSTALVLESLAYAYEISGDIKYLKDGLLVFKDIINTNTEPNGGKYIVGDAVVHVKGPGPKQFAQRVIPIMVYYKAIVETGLIEN